MGRQAGCIEAPALAANFFAMSIAGRSPAGAVTEGRADIARDFCR
jgi:hypothetical protein